eukprot:4806838-Amphidinium_carterae.1
MESLWMAKNLVFLCSCVVSQGAVAPLHGAADCRYAHTCVSDDAALWPGSGHPGCLQFSEAAKYVSIAQHSLVASIWLRL